MTDVFSRCLIALGIMLTALALTPEATEAQDVTTDTLRVTVEGDNAYTVFETFEVNTRIGDTIQYVAQAYDSDGDPVTASYVYASSDTTVIVIDAITGLAVTLRKGVVDIWVQATVGLEMRIASFRPPDSLNWSGNDSIPLTVWEPSLGDSTWYESPPDPGYWVHGYILVSNPDPTIQFCAYVTDAAGYLVGDSPGQPVCPAVFPIRPLSSSPVFAHLATYRTFRNPTDLRAFAGQG